MSDKLSVKEIIFKCACDIFSEKGFLDSTVKDITEKANVNVAAITYYFGSKENLIDMVVERYLDKLYGLFLILENRHAPPIERLRTYSDSFMKLINSNIYKNLVVQAIRAERMIEEITGLIKAHAHAYKNIIREITGIEDEHTLDLKTELYASAITYPVLLNSYTAQAIHLDFSRPDIREQYVDMLLKTLFS